MCLIIILTGLLWQPLLSPFWPTRLPCDPFLGTPVLLYSSPFIISFANLDFPGGSDDKVSAYNAGDLGSIPRLERSPGEGNGNHSSILAWKIPWTEELRRLRSMGLQRVGHDWMTSLSFFANLKMYHTPSPSALPPFSALWTSSLQMPFMWKASEQLPAHRTFLLTATCGYRIKGRSRVVD